MSRTAGIALVLFLMLLAVGLWIVITAEPPAFWEDMHR